MTKPESAAEHLARIISETTRDGLDVAIGIVGAWLDPAISARDRTRAFAGVKKAAAPTRWRRHFSPDLLRLIDECAAQRGGATDVQIEAARVLARRDGWLAANDSGSR